jgi:hypothetical protein
MIKTKYWEMRQKDLGRFCGNRKHYSQMSDFETKKIDRKLKRFEDWEILKHAKDRLKEKNIGCKYDDIVSTIYNCDIIEYKIDYNKFKECYEERVVVRGRSLVNGSYNLNVVFNITTGSVVTVWVNHVKDNHKTLDFSIYNKRMRVFA